MLSSWESVVDVVDDGLEFLVLQAVQGDPLLPRPETTNSCSTQICLNFLHLPGVHGVLVDVILADVNVGLALEIPHHHLLHVAQVPHGVAVRILKISSRINRKQCLIIVNNTIG